MLWLVSTYHKKYIKYIEYSQNIGTYTQTNMPKATLKTLSFIQRRGSGTDEGGEIGTKEFLATLCLGLEEHTIITL